MIKREIIMCENRINFRTYTDWVPYGMGSTAMYTYECEQDGQVDEEYWNTLMKPTWEGEDHNCPRFKYAEPQGGARMKHPPDPDPVMGRHPEEGYGCVWVVYPDINRGRRL